MEWLLIHVLVLGDLAPNAAESLLMCDTELHIE